MLGKNANMQSSPEPPPLLLLLQAQMQAQAPAQQQAQQQAHVQDGLLPAHKRRTGRMESLHEFQQRAISYDEAKRSPRPGEVYLEITTTRSQSQSRSHSQNVSDCTEEAMRRQAVSRRSTVSLFGNAQRTTKSLTKFYSHQAKVLAFLVLLGVIGGPVSYTIRLSYGHIASLRLYLISLTTSPWLQYLLWTTHTVAFTVLAVVWTRLSPVAAGSGVSQMKSILTGIDARMYLPGYFDASTLVAKIGGLVCAVGSGLVVGTEGAFVHIMSIITHHLLHTKPFAGFSDRLNARLQLLAAACAVGVSSTFSSPIGGVLFSMEVTSTYYLISNYMKAFISSVSGSLMLQLTLTLANSSSSERGTSVFKTALPAEPFQMWEIPLFVVLGAVVGLVASAMIALLRALAQKRKSLRSSDSTWKQTMVQWVDPIAVAIVTATLSFWPGEFARNKSMDDLAILFTEAELPASWQSVSKYYALSVLCAMYAILLPLCITLRVPTGVWLPTFIAGAALGRMFGEALQSIDGLSSVIPGAYALAGAAAFAAASTRTVSAAVITLEISGSMQLMLPIFCAVLVSIGVSTLCPGQSVYDTLLVCSGLPYLPLVDFDPQLVTGDIIEPLLVFVTKRTTVAKLLLAVQRMPGQDLPVVRSEIDMQLLGLVSSAQISKLIKFYYQTHHLPDVEVDLGDETLTTSVVPSWSTMARKLTKRGTAGFYGGASYDQAYHALSSTLRQAPPSPNANHGAGPLPFMLDDERMISLLSEGLSETKKEKLQETIKLSYGHLCTLKPMALTVSSATPLDELHMIFTMLRCDHCYVCEQGALVGVVTTKALLGAGASSKTV